MLRVKLNMANGIREFGHASPDRAAVVDRDRTFTFAAIDERSNRLASALLALECDAPILVNWFLGCLLRFEPEVVAVG